MKPGTIDTVNVASTISARGANRVTVAAHARLDNEKLRGKFDGPFTKVAPHQNGLTPVRIGAK